MYLLFKLMTQNSAFSVLEHDITSNTLSKLKLYCCGEEQSIYLLILAANHGKKKYHLHKNGCKLKHI